MIDEERVDTGTLEFDSFAPWSSATITKKNLAWKITPWIQILI